MTGASLLAFGTNVFRQLEIDSLRARFDVRGTETPPPNLVFVDIDTDALTALNETWPISRRHHAKLIRTIGRGDPSVIAYDIQFTEPTTNADDNALIGAVSDVGKIVLAATETDEQGATNVFGGAPIPGFRPANALLEPDPGGVLRRLHHSIGGLETLRGRDAPRSRRIGRWSRSRRVTPGSTTTDRPGRSPPSSSSTCSRARSSRTFFRDKIVVVGTSLASEQDLHPTPVGENMPGGEVQANAISTVLRGLPLRSVAARAHPRARSSSSGSGSRSPASCSRSGARS